MNANLPDNMGNLLILSGFDPTGKAGALLDRKIAQLHSVQSFIMPTAITIQTFITGTSFISIDPSALIDFSEKIFSEKGFKAVKIGMVPSYSIAQAISHILEKFQVYSVWDPIFKTSDGLDLCIDNHFLKIAEILLSKISIITPNIHEYDVLSNIINKESFTISQFCTLLKGGHANMPVAVDTLFTKDKMLTYKRPILSPKPRRGTGCALSTAFAANLAAGKTIEKSFIDSEKFMDKFLKYEIITTFSEE